MAPGTIGNNPDPILLSTAGQGRRALFTGARFPETHYGNEAADKLLFDAIGKNVREIIVIDEDLSAIIRSKLAPN